MRTAVRGLLSAAVLFIFASASARQPAQALSLEEAIAATLADNPAVKAAEYEERAAVQERRATIGLRMPQISVTGAYAYLGKDIGFDLNEMKTPVQGFAGQVLGSGLVPQQYIPQIQQLLDPMLNADWFLKIQDRSLGTVGGQVTLPIWLGGKINAAGRAAKIQERTAVAQGDRTRNALVSELVERYFGLALALQVVDVRQQVVDGVRRHLEDAAALEENGMIAKSERLYVEFKMAEAERELANARLRAQTVSSALQNTLNRSTEALPLTAMFILDRIEELAYYQDLAASRNPLLSQVSLKRDLAQEGVRLQRSAFLPQVVAMGGGSFYNYQVTGLVPRW
ncbi:MAG: TolC family protein, partial [Alistipes sp.]|nr:TolC family protein [Alistipes sp.]